MDFCLPKEEGAGLPRRAKRLDYAAAYELQARLALRPPQAEQHLPQRLDTSDLLAERREDTPRLPPEGRRGQARKRDELGKVAAERARESVTA